MKTKVLVTIATWGTKNDDYLSRLVAEYRSMPFDVDIFVLSNVARPATPGVEVVVRRPRKIWSLDRVKEAARHPWLFLDHYSEWKRHLDFPFAHKQILADRVNQYDLFIFSEDDTLITERNLRAFMDVSQSLPENEVPGFLRFEEYPDGGRNYPEVHGIFHWDVESVRKRGPHTLASFTNLHSACYVLTQPQLQRAINSGGFLVGPHSEQYDPLCTAATDPYTQCGMQRLISLTKVDDFLIHHLPNRYLGTKFGVDEKEFRRQIESLLRIGTNGHRPAPLFRTETKLEYGIYSKPYYEPAYAEVLSLVPEHTKTVLSIGCGSGATEARLADRGIRVTGVPLDSVIAGCAEAKGVEIVQGDFATARQKLTGRQFDCILLSNILHLIPDPVATLASFETLLSPKGLIVAVLPNTTQIGPKGRAIRGNGRIRHNGTYEQSGVHLATPSSIRSWFRNAGMHVHQLRSVLTNRAQKYEFIAKTLPNSITAAEFIALARTKT